MNYDEYLRYLRRKILMIQRLMANSRVSAIKESWFAEQVIVKEEAERKENKK